MLARLFTRSVASRSARPRFRPRVEGLEGREVPAAFTWLGGDSFDPASWDGPEGETPGEGADLFFDGTRSKASCDLGRPGMAFHSMHLVNGYDGTVTWIGGQLDILELASGALATPDFAGANDVSITSQLTWTGGIFNSTADWGRMDLLPGAVGEITPPQGKSLITGSDLVVYASTDQTPAATLKISGAMQFNNGAGAVVGGVAGVGTGIATLTLEGAANYALATAGDKTGFIRVLTNGRLTVQGPGTRSSDLPLWIDGGTARILGGATAQFQKNRFTGVTPNANVYMTSNSDGRLQIEGGSTLSAETAVLLAGGTLSTLASGASTTATISAPDFTNTGADVVIQGPTPPAGPHTKGTLLCTGNVTWSGGTYRPVIDVTGNTCDLWRSDKTFTVQAGAKLAPGTINVVGNFDNKTYLTIEAGTQIVGAAPPVDSVTYPYQIVSAGAPVNQWLFRKIP